MASNVLKIDLHMKLAAARNQPAAYAVFFDFKAAFPSISHNYMWAAFSHMGISHEWIHALRSLYVENRQTLRFGNFCSNEDASFLARTGVRQGCPISPLLFVLGIDFLLRIIKEQAPSSIVAAFADDIGMVMESWEDVCVVFKEFERFGKATNLWLNWQKTVIVPLGTYTDLLSAKESFVSHCAPSADCQVANTAKYLGIWLGPQAHLQQWVEQTTKYASRADRWNAAGSGLHYTIRIYNVFVFSVLSYIMQFADPPDSLLDDECKCIRKFAKGPGNWMRVQDIQDLRSLFHLHFEANSIRETALAAKLRLLFHENFNPIQAQDSIRDMSLDYDTLGRQDKQWIHSGIIYDLAQALLASTAQNATVEQVVASIDAAIPRKQEETREDRKKLHKGVFQKFAVRLLKQAVDRTHPFNFAYKRISRWDGNHDMDPMTARAARRCVKHIAMLPKLVTPRVQIAMLKTLTNAWCTARRFQQPSRPCKLGCPDGCDSLEHYSRCPWVVQFAEHTMRLPTGAYRGMGFWTMSCVDLSPTHLSRIAILVYSVWSALNSVNHVGTHALLPDQPLEERIPSSQSHCLRLLRRMAAQATAQHAKSRRLLR